MGEDERVSTRPVEPTVPRWLSMFAILWLGLLIHRCAGVGLAPGLYCGLETCYEVLGIEREDFNKSTLSKLYRQLARTYHPDRVRDEEEKSKAVVKFQQIATAYETLKDDETRSYYDYYLDHPEERYYNYYQYYRMKTPKVDVRLVIAATIILISTIQYVSAQQKYSEAVDYAKEQSRFRNMALEIARERKVLEFDRNGKPKKKQPNGVDADQVLGSIIEENISITGGYKKASVKDTLLYALLISPYTIGIMLLWWGQWVHKYHIRKEDYDDQAKLYLIRKNLGVSEEAFSPHIIKEYLDNHLWIKANFEVWKERKEEEAKEKQASSARYRQYRRYLKRTAGQTISFLED